jgi:hypothetical protein
VHDHRSRVGWSASLGGCSPWLTGRTLWWVILSIPVVSSSWVRRVPAGQGRGEVVELPADLGQGGVGEGSGLLVVQVLRIGEHDPPVLAVDVAVGVDRGDNGETGLTTGGNPGTTTRARAQ